MKKITKKQLAEWDIKNAWDICIQGQSLVYVAYNPPNYGRGGRGASWQVMRPGFKTNPDEPWYNYGNKTFGIWRHREKDERRLEALEWATKKYGRDGLNILPIETISEWERSPWGDWYPKGTFERLARNMQEKKVDE